MDSWGDLSCDGKGADSRVVPIYAPNPFLYMVTTLASLSSDGTSSFSRYGVASERFFLAEAVHHQ